jgi:hypothetical protein
MCWCEAVRSVAIMVPPQRPRRRRACSTRTALAWAICRSEGFMAANLPPSGLQAHRAARCLRVWVRPLGGAAGRTPASVRPTARPGRGDAMPQAVATTPSPRSPRTAGSGATRTPGRHARAACDVEDAVREAGASSGRDPCGRSPGDDGGPLRSGAATGVEGPAAPQGRGMPAVGRIRATTSRPRATRHRPRRRCGRSGPVRGMGGGWSAKGGPRAPRARRVSEVSRASVHRAHPV